MARYVASVETPWDREDAFAYVADFATRLPSSVAADAGLTAEKVAA